ncbi:hypothetical protein [Hymenobacter coccineus]|uniref:Uncharacterized protein n=1 Tax=Hymenobacter coccineus TaxID=1908235 RepID=A0A1G1THN7_9BACT|nr:hypothetical protein [Hymenobacter coccineus]OGX90392.1 hypothetical protein BEN49_06915 [Hymenobacter coccineus]
MRAAAQTTDSLVSIPPAGAPVVLSPAGYPVSGVRPGGFGFWERAEAIQRRLDGLLSAPLFAPDSLLVVNAE